MRHARIGRCGSRVLSCNAKGKGLDTHHIGCATAEGGSLGLVLSDRERLGTRIVRDPVLGVKGLAIYRVDCLVEVDGEAAADRE